MCARYSHTKFDKAILTKLGIDSEYEFRPRYNVAPSHEVVIVVSQENRPALKRARWGLIPSWAKDEKIGNSLINARSETVGEKPAFRHSFRRQRCLILSDGFYEWQKFNGRKQPIYFHLNGRRQFTFGGLWERWRTPEKDIDSFCIITVQPNELVSRIYDRMPFIVPQDEMKPWLDAGTKVDHLQRMLRPYSAGEMGSFWVNEAVNSPINDGEICLKEVTEPPVQKVFEF